MSHDHTQQEVCTCNPMHVGLALLTCTAYTPILTVVLAPHPAAHPGLCHAAVMWAMARTVGGVASGSHQSMQSPHVASFIRHSVLLGGFVPSLVLLWRLGTATWANMAPHAAAMSL